MAIFRRIVHNRQQGAASHEDQFSSWQGTEMNRLFPNHQRVIAEYHPLPLRGEFMFTGTMSHYPSGGSEDLAPDIISRFLSWYCFRCGEMQHRFTGHEFQPSINGAPHCVGDSTEPQCYDPKSKTPSLEVKLSDIVLGNQDRGRLFLQKRSFKMNCNWCRNRFVYAKDMFLHNVHDTLKVGHVCYADPLNKGVMVAAQYRRQLQNQVPAGRQQVAPVSGGAQHHNADSHGGNQDQGDDDYDYDGKEYDDGDDGNDADDEDDDNDDDDDSDDDEADSGADNHNADDHGGNGDQVEKDSGGAHDHSAETRDRNQDHQDEQVTRGADDRHVYNDGGNQGQIEEAHGDADDHNADNHCGSEDDN